MLLHSGYVQDTCLGGQFQDGDALLAVNDRPGVERPLDGDGHIALLDHTLHSGILTGVHGIVPEGEGRYRRRNCKAMEWQDDRGEGLENQTKGNTKSRKKKIIRRD